MLKSIACNMKLIYIYQLVRDKKRMVAYRCNSYKLQYWFRKVEKRKDWYIQNNVKEYADYLFAKTFGYRIDWQAPRDLNEWINYYAFCTNTQEWTRLADKYLVRDYIKERNLESILVPLLGKWSDPNEIDFSKLPDQFVIKSNHGSGDVIVVKDKASTNLEIVREKISNALNQKFGLLSAEPHYLRIKPCIIAEKYLDDKDGLIDYKVWCINGNPYCIMTISDRNIEAHTATYGVYDLEWRKKEEWLTPIYRNSTMVRKPKNLNIMLDAARTLSKGFPEVRVDFYDINDKLYFGEMTFTSACGRMTYFTSELLLAMGKLVKS